MIEFSCVCKQYKFSLPPETAGSLVQCPTCRRLVDVPTLHELTHLDEDGGYKFEGESNSKKLDAKIATRAFTRGRIDEFGQEIDLRTTFDEIKRSGVAHVPGTLDGTRLIPPKYDPVTGELIRPLAIKNEEPKRVLPVQDELDEPIDAVPIPAPKLSYSAIPPATISLGGVFLALFQPANLVVMGFVLLMHVLAHGSVMIVLAGFIFVFVAPLILLMGLIGHFGNAIDEVGPSGRDELPAPMRNVSFGEDIWQPFAQLFVALFLAFFPLLLSFAVVMPPGLGQAVKVICLAAGIFIAPALILTSVTSGTYLNLRPDRILGVIGCCSSRYGFLVFMFGLASAVYGMGLALIGAATMAMFHTTGVIGGLAALGIGYGVLAAGIYLMHAFCWQLGLIYRSYHDRFPWVLQRHVPVRMAQRTRSRPGHLPPMGRG